MITRKLKAMYFVNTYRILLESVQRSIASLRTFNVLSLFWFGRCFGNEEEVEETGFNLWGKPLF
jgi:hypothetical protein